MSEQDFSHGTRLSYDAVAADYAEYFRDELATKPWDRAMLTGFAEVVGTERAPSVADIGCGPGHLTARLCSLGLPAFGIDLSPEMVAVARRAYPALHFEVGSMLALDRPDAGLDALVAWYSMIHLPPQRLPDAFAEFARVLVPGGHLLLAFQAGEDSLRLTEAFGHDGLTLEFHRNAPDHIATLLEDSGFVVRVRVMREPEEGETTPQAFLLARIPEPTPA